MADAGNDAARAALREADRNLLRDALHNKRVATEVVNHVLQIHEIMSQESE